MAKLACYSNYLVTFYFCIPVSYEEEDIFFFDVSSRNSCRNITYKGLYIQSYDFFQ